MYGRELKVLINETNENIRHTSFVFFLEKGYEATNIRDICKVVDIKPSSLYFYYKSKQELFLSIYDEIWKLKIKFYENIELNGSASAEKKLKQLFKIILNYHSENIVNEKFLLRYHLFPAEEINILIKDRYIFWKNEENSLLMKLVYKCKGDIVLKNDAVINDFLYSYKSFLQHQTINMVTNNIKPASHEIDMNWSRFWNSFILSM